MGNRHSHLFGSRVITVNTRCLDALSLFVEFLKLGLWVTGE